SRVEFEKAWTHPEELVAASGPVLGKGQLVSTRRARPAAHDRSRPLKETDPIVLHSSQVRRRGQRGRLEDVEQVNLVRMMNADPCAEYAAPLRLHRPKTCSARRKEEALHHTFPGACFRHGSLEGFEGLIDVTIALGSLGEPREVPKGPAFERSQTRVLQPRF